MDGQTVCQEIHAIDAESASAADERLWNSFQADQSITEEGYEFLDQAFDGNHCWREIEQMFQKGQNSDLA